MGMSPEMLARIKGLKNDTTSTETGTSRPIGYHGVVVVEHIDHGRHGEDFTSYSVTVNDRSFTVYSGDDLDTLACLVRSVAENPEAGGAIADYLNHVGEIVV